MNKDELEFTLKGLAADATLEALSRRERGQPPHPDSPLTDQDLQQLAALGCELGEDFEQQKTAELLAAVQPAKPAKPEGAVVPLANAAAARTARRLRVPRGLWAAGPLLIAASFLFWLMPPWGLDAEVALTKVQSGADVRQATEPEVAPGAVRLTRDGCVTVQLALPKAVAADDLAAHAYLRSDTQTLRWDLALQPDQRGGLSTPAGCQRLPAELRGDHWELVLLVGYPGRLWWRGAAALRESAASGTPGKYQGIQVLRTPLELDAPKPSN